MKKNLNAFIPAGVAALLGVAMASCGSDCGKDAVAFEPYQYSAVAEFVTEGEVAPEGEPAYWNCTGQGTLPVKMGSNDITQLRDTLMAVASVSIEGSKAAPKYPQGFRKSDIKGDSVASVVSNRLTVDLLTPQVAVFRNYKYAYPEGAAHPVHSNVFVNYEIKSNKVLALSDIFKQGYEKNLQEMLANDISESHTLLVDKEDVPVPANFRITDDGVDFVYGLYEVAPYSDGEITASFTVYQLADLLTPEAKALILGAGN